MRALIREPDTASWERIHHLLMEYGLLLHASEKGGFTVCNEEQTIHVKTSKVFRDLFSGNEMQAWRDTHLGQLQPPGATALQQPQKTAYRADRVAKRDPVTRELRKQERRAEREGLLTKYKEAKTAFEVQALPNCN